MVSITVVGRTPRARKPKPPPKGEAPYVAPEGPAPSLEAAKQRRRAAARHGVPTPVASVADAPDTLDDPTALGDDLAAVVAKRTMRRLASGELEPTLRDGLIAQQLLDRRAEKAADRSFMLALAQAMAGGGYTAPAQLLPGPAEPEDEVVEGYFEEIPLAPEHLRSE